MTASAPYREQDFSAEDGLRLHARVYGESEEGRLPVVCLSGLTRNCRDFHDLALLLSGDTIAPRKVIALDYRGRGKSEYDPEWTNYNAVTEARDVATALTVLGIEHAAFIGTSRGALVTMMLGAIRPAAIAASIFNDAGPVTDGAGLARIRSQFERMPRPANMPDAIRLLRAAHGASFPALDDADWERMARAIYREEKGRLVADHDPRLMKTLQAINLSRPLPVLWPQFHGLTRSPMLVFRGAHSDILSVETLTRMAASHPDIETVTVEGQGHAPMLEMADLPHRIGAFLARVDKTLP